MRIGFLSDTHLDYASGHHFTDAGVNVRTQDGFDALTETVDQMLEANVDVVLHGGDLFHRSIPTVRGIIHAREQFGRLHAAGIPVIGIVGNHDYPNTVFRAPASLAIADPGRSVTMVSDPHQVFELAPGINVHAVSHTGWMPRVADPSPTDGDLNILLTHGAAEIPGYNTMFTCEDSPAEAWLPYEILSRDWSAVLTGHYHNRHRLPLDHSEGWYAGSALRRGFSDPEGERGWLQVDISPAGVITVTQHNISQRAQFDLPLIDAAGLTGDEVFERIKANLDTVDGERPIVRQRVANVTSAVRKTVPVGDLATDDFLVWQARFSRPETLEADGTTDSPRMTLTDAWADYIASAEVLDTDREAIAARGLELIQTDPTPEEGGH